MDGLHDMAGNVWEWVEDAWNDKYKAAPTDGRVWSGGDTQRRVLRGGSWNNNPRNLRVSNRNNNDAGNRNDNNGFRCSLEAIRSGASGRGQSRVHHA